MNLVKLLIQNYHYINFFFQLIGKFGLSGGNCVNWSINEGKGNFSIGAILRNSEGKVLAALAKRIRNLGSVLGAELQAIMSGLLLCKDRGFHNIQVYSDSLTVVQAVTRPLENLIDLEIIILNIGDLLQLNFFLDIHHIFRSTNEAAYCLVFFVLTSSFPCLWIEDDFLLWLEEIVLADFFASS